MKLFNFPADRTNLFIDLGFLVFFFYLFSYQKTALSIGQDRTRLPYYCVPFLKDEINLQNQ